MAMFHENKGISNSIIVYPPRIYVYDDDSETLLYNNYHFKSDYPITFHVTFYDSRFERSKWSIQIAKAGIAKAGNQSTPIGKCISIYLYAPFVTYPKEISQFTDQLVLKNRLINIIPHAADKFHGFHGLKPNRKLPIHLINYINKF